MNPVMKKMGHIVSATFFAIIAGSAANADGVLARCGASDGFSFFLHDEIMNPNGPFWDRDGMSEGYIQLIKLGEEWDIQFGDALNEYSYRQDGARVLPWGNTNQTLTVGIFRQEYIDIYSFDAHTSEVVWSSHKMGTPIRKVGVYTADCSYISPELPSQ